MPVAPEVVARDAQGGTTVRATRLTQEIRLDGRLDKSVYQTVEPITGFIQWVANEMRHDVAQLRQNDSFSLLLDTFHDRRNGVAFLVTPIGGYSDFAITNEGNVNTDWNVVWTCGPAGSRAGGPSRSRSHSSRCGIHPARRRCGAFSYAASFAAGTKRPT